MLYKNSAQQDKVDKSSELEYIGTLEGTLKTNCSIINPQVAIEYNKIVDFNYVYISSWNRYYYVTDIQYGIKNIVIISLKVDVLMSFKTEIYNQHALIKRNEFDFNEQLVDYERAVRDNPIIEQINSTIYNEFFEPDLDVGNIILNVIGGE